MKGSWLIAAAVVAGCGAAGGMPEPDGASTASDATPASDAAPAADAAPDRPDAATGGLDDLRDALFDDYADRVAGGDGCAAWDALHPSARAVFLTLTHRLYLSQTADGQTALDHIDALYLVLGGGDGGGDCGGGENNRLFLSMDAYLWARMVEAWQGDLSRAVGDGGGGVWAETGDLAGPHDPFDASNETESGLRCALLVELDGSRPPTAQAHFFETEGAAVPITRGPGIDLPADPHMLELDHDYDCFHRSNPLCGDFEDRYGEHYGDVGCTWIPRGCTATGTGCYAGASG